MNIFKKQGVAWVITAVVILIAIGIGGVRAETPTPGPGYVDTPAPTVAVPADDAYCVRDYAGVLSYSEIETLSQVNRKLVNDLDVVVGCVTVNYGGDLYQYALDMAADMNLKENDFIAVLDISGENYWLLQGEGIIDLFSDEDCGDYTWTYLESDFARGNYGEGLIKLQDALADWYYDHA